MVLYRGDRLRASQAWRGMRCLKERWAQARLRRAHDQASSFSELAYTAKIQMRTAHFHAPTVYPIRTRRSPQTNTVTPISSMPASERHSSARPWPLSSTPNEASM